MADGVINFSTALDNQKLEEQLEALKQEISAYEQQIAQLEKEQTAAIKEREAAYKGLQKAQAAYRASEEKAAQLEASEQPLIDQAEQLRAQIAQQQAIAADAKNRWNKGEVGADGEQTRALQQAAALKQAYNEVLSKIQQIDDKIAQANTQTQQQAAAVTAAQTAYDGAAANADSIAAAIESTNAALSGAEEGAGQVQDQLNRSAEAAQRVRDKLEEAKGKTEKFGSRLKRMAMNALVFSVVRAALSGLVSQIKSAISANDEASAAFGRLKGALLTLVQPIVSTVIPVLTTLMNVITRVISLIGNLFGKTFFSNAKSAAKSLNEQSKAVSGVGSAAKEASKYLADFDELNVMQDESSSGGGGGGTDSGIDADFDFDTGLVTDKLDEIAIYVAGAALAVGALLTFSGANIPLGLGLMALGALTMAAEIKENWGCMPENIQNALNTTLLILGVGALAIGAILTFTGANLPLGIGLMVLGAASLAAMVAINWSSIPELLQGPVGAVVAILSAAMLVIGAVLTFSGANLLLGIGLMAVGAAGLAAEAALNWDTIIEALQGPVGAVVAMLSGALLVAGALLTFSGVNLPLGIGLMAAGAVGLATEAVLNWDTIKTALQGPIGKITAAVSAALLVIGAVLTFTGAALPLGIGLMAAGAAGLATVAALNWDTITEALQGPIGAITAIVSGALIVLGAVLCFTGAALPLGIGMLIAGGAGLATVVALNWNFITEKIAEVWENVKTFWNNNIKPIFTVAWWLEKFDTFKQALEQKCRDAVNAGIGLFNSFIRWINAKMTFSWGSFEAFGQTVIPAGSLQLVNIPEIPLLAQGAVIPPNREFLAVLGDQSHGTNIEAPLETIKQAVAEVNGGLSNDLLREQNELLREILGQCGVYLDGRKVTEYITQQQRQQARAIGGAYVY